MDDTLAGDVELFDHSSNSQVTSTPTSATTATSTATSPPPVLHPPRMASSHPTPPRPPHSDDDGDDDDESKMADESFSGVPPSETTEGHSRERRMSELAAMEQRRLRLLDGEVVLDVDEQNRPIPYASNVIKTSKYTALTFLPQNLFEQLIRPANFYFVCIAILQAIPAVSISQGKPTILLPLVFVLTVSGIKDAFEDRKRHLADTQENRRKYLVWNRTKGKFTVKQSSDICVGDIVKVIDDEIYPADLLQIYSTSPGGYSYVETANLDGETNLKIKMIPKPLRHIRGEQDLDSLSFTLECDPPNGMLDQWGGTLLVSHKAGAPPPRSVSGDDDPAAPGSDQATVAGLDNLLLRGSKLRNTGFIFAVAVYTGRETKIRQNSNAKKRASIKRSSVERAMNRQILGMFGMQVTICFFAGIGAATWAASHSNSSWYLDITDKPGVTGLIRFFTWFIIFAGFVPISLLVSMEMVKFWQGLFISWDENMAVAVPEEESGWQFARAQTSGLNEELGQVQFILSDKTGTLTCNSMDFRKCVVGPRQYGTGETDISKAAKERAKAAGHRSSVSVSSKADIEDDARIYDAELEGETEIAPHVSFNARRSLEKALSAHGQELDLGNSDAAPTDGVAGGLIDASSYEHQFLMNLALANTVFPTQDKNDPSKILMKASSPDEEALVEFARFMGYELCERNPPHVSVRVTNHETGESKVLKFEQLALLDFTSKRKRMSVVLRDESGRVRIYSKGADNMIGEILRDAANVGSSQEHWGTTVNRLTRFGDQGLRTLLVAGAQKEASFWDGDGDGQGGLGWRYREAMNECAVEGPDEQGHFKGSCSNECRRCAIEEEVERAFEMDLIGATAIEDKLQEYVPDSVRAFLEAGISVWVLTGDKLETAINIGMACNLLESSMEKRGNLLRIQGETVHEVRAELDRHMDRIHERDAHAFNPLGMVMTSRAFSRVVKGHMIDDFWFVATHCKSVVCCRMQPNQKAQIVRLVKDSTDSGVTTLAVGDGANDEQMIIEADVGVGIRGVEGTTAVRASDYAVSRFHFMRRLLFVHGRLNYRRISTLICYIFYKNSMICFTQLWFGIMSGFSGQPIYLEWAYQLYNVCFTAVPILVFAVFDYDIEPKTLMQYASIYRDTNRGQLFNVRIFWQWLVFSVLQSIIVFAFPYAAYDMTTADSSGQSHGVWYMGVAVYTSVVIVVNLKLALLMTSWTWLHHFSIWGSIIFYFMAMMVLNSSTAFATAGGDYYFLVFRLMGTARFWFVVILTVVTALFVDFALQAYHAIACPHVEGFAFAGWISDIAKEFAAKVHGNDGSGKKYHKPPPVPVRTERNYSAASITAPKKLRASIGIVDADSDNAAALESVRAQYPHPDAPQEQRSPQAAVRASLARRHTGFDFSATGGMGRRLGFEF